MAFMAVIAGATEYAQSRDPASRAELIEIGLVVAVPIIVFLCYVFCPRPGELRQKRQFKQIRKSPGIYVAESEIHDVWEWSFSETGPKWSLETSKKALVAQRAWEAEDLSRRAREFRELKARRRAEQQAEELARREREVKRRQLDLNHDAEELYLKRRAEEERGGAQGRTARERLELYFERRAEEERAGAQGLAKATGKPKRRESIPSSVRYEVLARKFCAACGHSAADDLKMHVDHIKPHSKGGSDDLSNLQLLCQDCNLGKGDRDDTRF